MSHRFRLDVRFGDLDAAGIVYYPRYLHFCHVAMEELFAHVMGTPYHKVIVEEDVGYPTVRVEAEFAKPVGFGETLDMRVEVERIGRRSVSFLYEGRRVSDGSPAFRVRSTAVAVKMSAWHSIPIPEAHRRGFDSIRVGAV
jgi:4-hydroxybenzoyl-CoA thioesterase